MQENLNTCLSNLKKSIEQKHKETNKKSNENFQKYWPRVLPTYAFQISLGCKIVKVRRQKMLLTWRSPIKSCSVVWLYFQGGKTIETCRCGRRSRLRRGHSEGREADTLFLHWVQAQTEEYTKKLKSRTKSESIFKMKWIEVNYSPIILVCKRLQNISRASRSGNNLNLKLLLPPAGPHTTPSPSIQFMPCIPRQLWPWIISSP